MKRCVIISGGEITDYEYIRTLILSGDYIICADHGYDHAVKMGIAADLVIGDMDSVSGIPPADRQIVYPSSKNYTDTELAVRKALDLGFQDFLLLGCTGGRTDHALANIFLLKLLLPLGKSAKIADEFNTIYAVRTKLTVSGTPGTFFSLIPLTQKVTGITLHGAKYPLLGADIEFGSTLGVSNEFAAEGVSVELTSGLLLVIIGRS